MRDELIEILEGLGYTAQLQGSLAKDESYPEAFFTIWNDDTPGAAFYDDDARRFEHAFTVYFYAEDPVLVAEMTSRVRQALRAAGWIVQGKGYDVPVDQPTHTGRAIDVIGIENN